MSGFLLLRPCTALAARSSVDSHTSHFGCDARTGCAIRVPYAIRYVFVPCALRLCSRKEFAQGLSALMMSIQQTQLTDSVMEIVWFTWYC